MLSPTGNTGDAIFRALMFLVGLFVVSIVIAMLIALASDSMLSIRQFGFHFLISRASVQTAFLTFSLSMGIGGAVPQPASSSLTLPPESSVLSRGTRKIACPGIAL